VEASDIRRIEAHRAALKREWETLLRTEPTLSPLGNPDTLVFMMDETISNLLELFRQDSPLVSANEKSSPSSPLQRRCACGLNPLLSYYSTGELAMRAVASPFLGAKVDELVAVFHNLARREIDTLCSVCCYRQPASTAADVPSQQTVGSGR